MSVVQQLALRRRQQKRQNIRAGIQLLVFVASLIPMCIVAWKFNLADFAPQPQQAMAPPPQQHVSRPARLTHRTVTLHKQQRPEPIVEPRVAIATPRPRPTTKPAPQIAAPVKPDVVVEIDLSRRRSRQKLDCESPDPTYRILALEGCGDSFAAAPSDGLIDLQTPATFTFAKPFDFVLTASLERVGTDGVMLIIEPTLGGRAVILSAIERRRAEIVREGQSLDAQLADMKREQSAAKAFLEKPGAKLWIERDRAYARSKQLVSAIPAAEHTLSVMRQELDTVELVLEFANRMHDEGRLLLVEQ